MAFILNIHYFINYSIPFEGWDCFNTILVFIFAAAGVVSLLTFFKLILVSIRKPEEDGKHNQEITVTLLADTRKEPMARYFNFIFLVRHLMMIFNIILFNGHGEIQGLIFILLDFVNLIYVVIVQPFDSRPMNRLQMVNELTIYFCSNMMLLFNNPALDDESTLIIGWAYIGLVGLNIFGNIGYTTY